MSRAVEMGSFTPPTLLPPLSPSPALSPQELAYVQRLIAINPIGNTLIAGTEEEKTCKAIGRELFLAAAQLAAQDSSDQSLTLAGRAAMNKVCNALFTCEDHGPMRKRCVALVWKEIALEVEQALATFPVDSSANESRISTASSESETESGEESLGAKLPGEDS